MSAHPSRMSSGLRALLASACTIAAARLLVGCVPPPVEAPPRPRPTEYVRVRSTLSVHRRSGPGAEVVNSRLVTAMRGSIQRIAVSAPDACLNPPVSELHGVMGSVESGTVLHLQCGSEMAELERAFTRAGFAVISWRIVRAAQHPGGTAAPLSASQAARTLDADLLVEVNDLGRVTHARPAVDGMWVRELARSSANGHWGEGLDPHGLSPQDIATFRNAIARAEQSFEQIAMPGVALDLSVVAPESGQVVWFFRELATFALEERRSVSLLLANTLGTWREVQPVPDQMAEEFPTAIGFTYTQQPDHLDEERRHTVMRSLLEEGANALVTSFGAPAAVPIVERRPRRNGRDAEVSEPPPAPAPVPVTPAPTPPPPVEPAPPPRRHRRR